MGRLRESKYGLIALGIAVTEATFIGGGLAVVYALGLWGRAPIWLEHAFAAAYLGGLAAPVFAVVGLSKGSGRVYAAIAIVLAVVNLGIGGLVFAV
ncbi:MAG: hypothetical protein ABSF71_39180 [Terriglobia bacterium]|jgi:hypothetical protein